MRATLRSAILRVASRLCRVANRLDATHPHDVVCVGCVNKARQAALAAGMRIGAQMARDPRRSSLANASVGEA